MGPHGSNVTFFLIAAGELLGFRPIRALQCAGRGQGGSARVEGGEFLKLDEPYKVHDATLKNYNTYDEFKIKNNVKTHLVSASSKSASYKKTSTKGGRKTRSNRSGKN